MSICINELFSWPLQAIVVLNGLLIKKFILLDTISRKQKIDWQVATL